MREMGEVVITDDERARWTIEDALDRVPSAAQTFVRLRTACAGCTLARFCTLADVARAYDIPLATLLSTLFADAREHEES